MDNSPVEEGLNVEPSCANHDGRAQPIDMVLFCPACGLQHIDEPEFIPDPGGGDLGVAMEVAARRAAAWTNPPHRSHLCHGCGHIWRPADVPTNGVARLDSYGRADSAPIRERAGYASAAALSPSELAQDGSTRLIDWKSRAQSAEAMVATLSEALRVLSDAVFGWRVGDEPNVYADYDRLIELGRLTSTALTQARNLIGEKDG
jgi:hypothetical protein